MPQNITAVLTSLNRKVSPGNTSQGRDIYGTMSEAASNLLSAIKPKELSRRVIIENALYDQVDRFHCPEDLDQQLVMQVYRLDKNRNVDTFYNPVWQTSNRRFDEHRLGDKNLITIEWDKGVKYIKLSNLGRNNANSGVSNTNDGVTIDTMDRINSNGLWQSFGNVTNLINDNLTYVAGSGSLRFDINTSDSTGGIENFTLTPFSIAEFFMTGKIFTWLNLPNITNGMQLQTVTMEMYSSAGNGYSITVNSPHDTDTFQEGQNLLGFELDPSVMTTIGSPDPSALNHIKFTFTSNGTFEINKVNIDNIVLRKGTVYGIQYISKFMFRDTSGIWKENPSDPSDEVMLDYEAYQLFVDQSAIILGQEIFTDTVMNKKGFIFGKIGQMQQKIVADYAQYRKNYKAEFIPEQQKPYNFGVNFGYNNRGLDDGHRFNHSTNGDNV